MVEINGYCQTSLFLQGETVPTNEQAEEIERKIDSLLEKLNKRGV